MWLKQIFRSMKWWFYCDRCEKNKISHFHIVNIYKRDSFSYTFYCKKCSKELLDYEAKQRLIQFEKSIKFYALLKLL